MEESHDEFDQELSHKGSRKIPIFLKVICIITFVGSGIAITSGLVSIATSSFTAESLRRTQSIQQDFPSEFGELNGIFSELLNYDAEEVIRWTNYTNISTIVGGIFCLIGALIMWKLRKSGYFVYIVGCIVPTVVGLIAMSHMYSGMMGAMGYAGVLFGSFFSIAFIIMYGLNLKHMR